MLNILNQITAIKNELDTYKVKGLLDDFRILTRLNVELEIYIITKHKTELEQAFFELSENYWISFYYYTQEEKRDYSAIEFIFESSDVVDYGLKYRFHSLLEDEKAKTLRAENDAAKQERGLPPIITFYSYKGGMGRTTTMTSYALHLAVQFRRKVVVMDFDLEAPGYLNFFNLAENQQLKNGNNNGIIEYLLDSLFIRNTNNLSLDKYYIQLDKVHTGTDGGEIFVFPAGNLLGDENKRHYLEGLARLDLASEKRIIDIFLKFFITIKETLNPDIILLDSRTGFNDIYGMLALVMSDVIVGFFGSSEQTKPGLEFLLQKLSNFQDIEVMLLNSILPQEATDNQDAQEKFNKYVENFEDKPQKLAILPLNRITELEMIGVRKLQGESNEDILVDLVRKNKLPKLDEVFKQLNEFENISKIFPKEIKENLELKDLREKILAHIQDSLPDYDAFAEGNEITKEDFFYRKPMEELFEKDKFIVRGFKGTGKTYLYKALKDEKLKDIQDTLKQRAGKEKEDFRFIDIISEKGKDANKLYDFSSLQISEIKDRHYYFKYFWVVYTWNSLMLDRKKVGYETTVSEVLQQQIITITPDSSTTQRFDKIIKNIDLLVEIENDLKALNSYLEKNKINLVILYDQLDNLVKPENWGIVISPLLDFWWNNLPNYSNFYPKIFIRTDLFDRIKNTNTGRWESNIISIEWNKDEVYAYLFKIVFSSDKILNYFFDLIKQNQDGNYENAKNKLIELKNILLDNQRQVLQKEEQLKPLMELFFGNLVITGTFKPLMSYYHPYDWFYKNLSNANAKSISLRPFINLIKGATDLAIKKPSSDLPIIHSAYYADLENRDDVAERHFNDLVKEDDVNNEDIKKIFDYFRKGKKYKFIYITEEELHQLLKEVIQFYGNALENKNEIALTQLLEAHGILSREIQYTQVIYKFPQIYKYWLGLHSRSGKDLVDRAEKQLLKIGDIVDCKVIKIYHNNILVKIDNLADLKASIFEKEYNDTKPILNQVVKAKVINHNKITNTYYLTLNI